MCGRPEPCTKGSCNPPSSSRAWGLGSAELHAVAFAGASQRCHHNHECKSESEKTNNAFGHSLAALNSAGASSPVPLKTQENHAPGRLISPLARDASTRLVYPRDFLSRVVRSHNKSRQLVFRELSRKTVVSKWYPQLSQVHKCRTQRSFTCSDQSGAINASPHCAQGLKYLGRADRGLVAVSRDISKPPKSPPRSCANPSRGLWRRHDCVIRIKLFE